jgi:hypothetical protein
VCLRLRSSPGLSISAWCEVCLKRGTMRSVAVLRGRSDSLVCEKKGSLFCVDGTGGPRCGGRDRQAAVV